MYVLFAFNSVVFNCRYYVGQKAMFDGDFKKGTYLYKLYLAAYNIDPIIEAT